MASEEVVNGLIWSVTCQDCKSHTGGRGIKSIPQAEKWMAEHSGELGHRHFEMKAGVHFIGITCIAEEKHAAGELCDG